MIFLVPQISQIIHFVSLRGPAGRTAAPRTSFMSKISAQASMDASLFRWYLRIRDLVMSVIPPPNSQLRLPADHGDRFDRLKPRKRRDFRPVRAGPCSVNLSSL